MKKSTFLIGVLLTCGGIAAFSIHRVLTSRAADPAVARSDELAASKDGASRAKHQLQVPDSNRPEAPSPSPRESLAIPALAPPDPVEDGPEQWRKQYEDAAIAELAADYDAIEKQIAKAAAAEFGRRFDAGYDEKLRDGGRMYDSDWDRTKIMQVRVQPSGAVSKVVLPEEEFPDLYALKHKAVWLDDQTLMRNVAATMASATKRK